MSSAPEQQPLKNREIVNSAIAAPKAAGTLLNELDRYSSRK